MQKVKAPYYATLHEHSLLQDVSAQLDQQEKNVLAHTPWQAFAYKPEVTFVIAHNHDCLFVKFFVREKSVRAVFRRDSDPVYKDSCVEFFISFQGDIAYYNLEFNSLGTCTVGYGPQRQCRTILPEAVTKRIKRGAKLSVGQGTDVQWQLTLIIPLATFCFHTFDTIKGQHCRVNFFKCGDDMPTPHFVAWSNIESKEPNFHLPQFFGELELL